MDFGAKGDGGTDDTAAIKKAFAAVLPRRGGGLMPWIGEVVFPAGHYIISEPIALGATQIVRGEGYAKIEQKNPEKSIFECDYAWQITISGLSFEGGKDQIHFSNPNVDTGQIFIEKCKFHKADGAAVYVSVVSTSVKIVDCRFVFCRQALVCSSDQATMKDCWITSSFDMKNQAVIENRSYMRLENILGVPLVNGADQRWIDNYGFLTCVHFRFGGEFGGFTPVVNYAKPSKDICGSMVVIDSSICLNEGNAKRKAAVYLEEIPNLLVIKNSTISTPAIIVDPKIDLKTYFTGVKPGMVKVAIQDNVGEFLGEIPELLKNPVYPEGPKVPSLGEKEAKEALEKAKQFISSLPKEKREAAESNGHREQTDPAKYMVINTKDYVWDLSDRMDAKSSPNSESIAMEPLAEGAILMCLTDLEHHGWPHVLIKDVTINLDKTPWLSFKLRDLGFPTSATTACRIVDKETGTSILLGEFYSGFYAYRAFDLKKLFGLSGKRKFDIKFYYLGVSYNHPHQPGMGDYIYLDFIRAEEE